MSNHKKSITQDPTSSCHMEKRICKLCKTRAEAETHYQRLYDEWNFVKLVSSPFFDSGIYTWLVSSKTYAVGWYECTEEDLLAFPEDERENTVIRFGGNQATMFDSYQQASDFMGQIIANNSTSNLKLLTSLGARGLFVCRLVKTNLAHPKYKFVRCESAEE